MPPPPTWTVTGLLNYFHEVHAADDRRFAFILGAGASFDSGIPMAGQLVDRWLQELHAREDHERRPLAAWATAQNLDIDGFEHARAVEFYSQVFARRFADQPDEGYAYLERILHGRDPSFGYSVLAQVLATTRHRVVITTNFDNLVADALAIYTDQLPFVCGHESLAGFVRINPRRPLVIKVHRDLLLAPKNRVEELAGLPDALVQSLRDLLRSYTPIVIGYGGNDGSLMGLLRDVLQPGDIPGGIYWCYWHGAGLPGAPILDVVRRHRGKLIPIQGFDELMLQLGEGLGFQRMDQRIEQRASERARKYRESVELLQRRVYPRPEPPPEPPPVDDVAALADDLDEASEPDALSFAAPTSGSEAESGPLEERPPATDRISARPAPAPVVHAPAPPPATSPTPPAASSSPVSHASASSASDPGSSSVATRGLPLGPVLSARPSRRDPAATRSAPTPRPATTSAGAHSDSTPPPLARETDAAPTPAESAPLQQSMQALVPDDPAAHDWWTLKLHAERLPTSAQRITAYREAARRFPDNLELVRSLARELAVNNAAADARAIYRHLEEMAPGDVQVHIDLAILFLYWGNVRKLAGDRARDAWQIARAQRLGTDVFAAIALVAAIIARLDHNDDTTPLRLLRGLLPVLASPLLPLELPLLRAITRLDDPSSQLYRRLFDCMSGRGELGGLDIIDRWRNLVPLAPEAVGPDELTP